MKKLNILFYHPWIYLKGGAEKVLVKYRELSRHNVVIATSYLSESTTFVELSKKKPLLLKGIFPVSENRDFISLIKSLLGIMTVRYDYAKYDIVIISSEGFGDFLSLLIPTKFFNLTSYVLTPLKVIYDKETNKRIKKFIKNKYRLFLFKLLEPVYRFFNTIVWRRYKYIIADSKNVKNRIIEGNLSHGKDIAVIYPGTDVYYKGTVSFVRPKYFIVFGRIMWQKNIEIAIKAFKMSNLFNFKLIITGHVDRKSEEYLNKLKKMSTGDENILFYPNADDKKYFDLIKGAYACIFTPPNEDWGIVPVEAMSYGKPVIASQNGGQSESIEHLKSGILCKYNVSSFSNAIKILGKSEQLRNKMAQNALLRSKLFTWKKFAEEMDSKIEDNLNIT